MAKAKKGLEKMLSEMGQKMDELIDEIKETGENVSDEAEEKINDLKEYVKFIRDAFTK